MFSSLAKFTEGQQWWIEVSVPWTGENLYNDEWGRVVTLGSSQVVSIGHPVNASRKKEIYVLMLTFGYWNTMGRQTTI